MDASETTTDDYYTLTPTWCWFTLRGFGKFVHHAPRPFSFKMPWNAIGCIRLQMLSITEHDTLCSAYSAANSFFVIGKFVALKKQLTTRE
jgi:hypothetical protein